MFVCASCSCPEELELISVAVTPRTDTPLLCSVCISVGEDVGGLRPVSSGRLVGGGFTNTTTKRSPVPKPDNRRSDCC